MSSPSSASGQPPSLQELRAARAASPSFARRFRRWLIAAGVFVFLVLFGFFGLPPIIKAQAIKQLSARLCRQVTIEKIRVNPLVLSASIEGFAIAEANPAAGEFTGWRRLYVNFDSWSLVKGEVGFQEITLDGFRVRVAKARDGALNFDDIVVKVTADLAAGSKPEAKPAGPSKPTPLAIGVLAVSDAQVSFADASRERPFSTVVGPLSFGLQKFRTVGDPNSPYQFEAVTAAGERLAWRGTVSADPVKSQGELTLANIDLARLSPYYHQLVAGELRSAFVDFSGKYSFELKGAAPALTLADGAFALRDVRFGAPGVEADAFALKRLAVTGISADSVALKAAIAKVSVEGVDVKVARDAEGVDLLRLVAPRLPASSSASPAAPAAAASPAALPVVTLGELSVSGVRVTAVDLTTSRRAEHRIEDVVLSLRDLDSANLGKALPLSLEVKLPEGGRVALSGAVSAQPLSAELDIALERVSFANASPYIEPFLNIRLAGGALRVNGKASLRDGAASFAGDFGIADFRTVDGKQAQDFVKWTDFSITGIKAATAPLAFHADEIRFVDPSATVRVEADGTLNIAQAAAANANAEPAPSAASEAPAGAAAPAARAPLPIAVTIGRFAFERAAFRFEDRSIKPAARGGISDFTGSITGLSSEALGRADVDLRGKVDGVAPVAITGKLNPLGQPAFVDLKVDFKGIDLQPGAGPYIGKFAGRELSRGNLNVAVSAKLQDRKLDTSNVVTLDQFFLGAKTDSPDATKLPVGLALALLRDTEGKIVIDLPVKGSLDDPNFKIGRVVVRVLVNILTKAATSPFSLLGAAFGGGGDELGWQDFPAGATTLDEAGLKKLETVAKALNARPALSLDIVGAYDPAADRDALQRAKLDQQIRAAAWDARRQVDPNTPPPEQMEITPDLRAGMLARLYAAAFPPAPGELAPVVVESSAAPVVAFPLAQTAGAERAERSRSNAGRPTKFNKRTVAVTPRQGSVAMAAAQAASRGESTAPAAEAASVAPAASAVAAESAVPVAPTVTTEEMVAKLAARNEIADAELQALGEARAQAIRAWLLETGKISGERIFLSPVTAGGGRVNLNLK